MPVHLQWRAVQASTDPHSPAFATSVHGDEAVRLAKLAAGRRCLEIGSAYGYSAVVMAAAGAVHVTAVDNHKSLPTRQVMEASVAACGVADKVTMLVADCEVALPELAVAGERFGLVFVDGDHGHDAVVRDVRLALTVLEPGGVLAVHDYGEDCCPGVAGALDELFPGGPDEVTVTLWQKVIA